jgi:DNA-binding NtrC family response regulator
MQDAMTQILLIGSELPLLEGLAQTFASMGFKPSVASTLAEGRELATSQAPLVAIVSREVASQASSETLGIPLARGGALVLYRSAGTPLVTFSASLQRAVLADLALPLERNRLVALVQHVDQRAKITGRSGADDPAPAPTP